MKAVVRTLKDLGDDIVLAPERQPRPVVQGSSIPASGEQRSFSSSHHSSAESQQSQS